MSTRAVSPSSALACCSREPAFRCWLRGGSKQLLPRIGWVAAIQHLAKHGVSVVGALKGAKRRVVIDPRQDDDFRVRRLLVAKEQPELLQEFRAEPVLVVVAERA